MGLFGRVVASHDGSEHSAALEGLIPLDTCVLPTTLSRAAVALHHQVERGSTFDLGKGLAGVDSCWCRQTDMAYRSLDPRTRLLEKKHLPRSFAGTRC